MRFKSFLILLTFSVVAVASVTFLISSSGKSEAQEVKRDIREQTSDDLRDFKSTFPIVEYSVAESITDPVRKAKSQKYGRHPSLRPNITGQETAFITVDWEAGLSALPSDKSVAVIVGRLERSTAFLSDNKGDVYAEFEIVVEEVFKNVSDKPLDPGYTVSAERLGGIVIFPGGGEIWVSVAGQGMPNIGGRYLFFLNYDIPGVVRQERDFHLLTAYELVKGRVIPLDSPGGGRHPLAEFYKGKKESLLIADLKALLRLTNLKKVT